MIETWPSPLSQKDKKKEGILKYSRPSSSEIKGLKGEIVVYNRKGSVGKGNGTSYTIVCLKLFSIPKDLMWGDGCYY